MERKIGEIFEYEGNWYQCVKDSMYDYCRGCASFKNLKCTTSYGNRDCSLKATCKKLEPIGDPFPFYDHIVQRYEGMKFPVILPEGLYAHCNTFAVDIEVKQDKENKEDMEANEKTISIPEGWEFGRIDDSGNIVLKEKKTELPKTWLGCLKCVNDLEVIDSGNNIEKWNFITLDGNGYIFGEAEHHLLPRGLGKPMLALCQLLVCRNAWWKQLGWKPDWNDRKSLKHCIHSDGFSTTDITQHSTFPRILAFPTEDTAMEFCNTFKDLIKEAKELL